MFKVFDSPKLPYLIELAESLNLFKQRKINLSTLQKENIYIIELLL